MTENMTDLQLSSARARASRENEDEELRVRRLKLEKVHILQQEKEASLEEERAELMRQKTQLEQHRRELARQQNDIFYTEVIIVTFAKSDTIIEQTIIAQICAKNAIE